MRILLLLLSLVALQVSAQDEQATNNTSVRFLASEWPPFEYTGSDGQVTGYSVEILKAIHDELGVPHSVRLFPWKRSYQLALDDANTAVFTMARSAKREDLFKWVGPIAPREIYIWKLKKREDVQVSSFEDVKNYVVGTVRGEAGEQQLLDMGFDLKKNIHSVDKQTKNFMLLYKERIDFLYGLEFTTIYGLKKQGFDPTLIEKSLLMNSGLEYYYGFNKDTPDEVVARYQKALDAIKANGKFDQIVSKYGSN